MLSGSLCATAGGRSDAGSHGPDAEGRSGIGVLWSSCKREAKSESYGAATEVNGHAVA